MSFSDLFFLYLFLPVCLLIYYKAAKTRTRNLILIVFSIIFYAWAQPLWVILLLASAAVNWILGLQIQSKTNPERQKPFVALAVIYNLGMLLAFKYTGFFAENLNALFRLSLPVPQIAQPIGLSFYTFRAISYILDVYWGKYKPQRKFSLFLLYLSFFPHMTAGPITRYSTMETALTKRRATPSDFYEGLLRIMVGLGKKVIVADHLLPIVDNFFGSGLSSLSLLGTWYTTILYMLYIYFDFSGYTDMALGIAKLFGFKLDENFRYPFMCKNIQEFWQRWHMSLGSFFRDYLLYVPLFGKRRKYGSLFLVWFCTGFWHGASWNFVLWGVFYGIVLILEKLFLLRPLQKAPAFVGHVYTMFVVLVAWVLFAFTDFSQVLAYLGIMFGRASAFANAYTVYFLRDNFVLLTVCAAACTPIARTRMNFLKNNTFAMARPLLVLLALIVCTAFIVDASYNPFLYFRF